MVDNLCSPPQISWYSIYPLLIIHPLEHNHSPVHDKCGSKAVGHWKCWRVHKKSVSYVTSFSAVLRSFLARQGMDRHLMVKVFYGSLTWLLSPVVKHPPVLTRNRTRSCTPRSCRPGHDIDTFGIVYVNIQFNQLFTDE